MEMVAQAQASAQALAEAQERDYREKVRAIFYVFRTVVDTIAVVPHVFVHPPQVLKLEQQSADQAATQAAAMERMAAKMFDAQAKMEQMMAQAEAKVS